MPTSRPYNLRERAILQDLGQMERAGEALDGTSNKKFAVICIHGILSSHDCFGDVYRAFKDDSRFNAWELCWYDYDYHDRMEANGKRLARLLQENFRSGDEVVLVCHSMGGIVARFAMLSTFMPFVKQAFLLGTPNLGVFRTHRLGLLAQLTIKSTHSVYGIFSQKQGVLDLTRIQELVKEFVERGEGQYENAEHVEYITVPGLYFDTDASSLRLLLERWKMAFAGLELQLAVISGLPFLSCQLDRPHDGIVEAASNCMIPRGEEVPESEKTAPILDVTHFADSKYAHIVHRRACKECTHVQIQHEERIIGLVADLIHSPSIADWDSKRGGSHDIIVRRR